MPPRSTPASARERASSICRAASSTCPRTSATIESIEAAMVEVSSSSEPAAAARASSAARDGAVEVAQPQPGDADPAQRASTTGRVERRGACRPLQLLEARGRPSAREQREAEAGPGRRLGRGVTGPVDHLAAGLLGLRHPPGRHQGGRACGPGPVAVRVGRLHQLEDPVEEVDGDVG